VKWFFLPPNPSFSSSKMEKKTIENGNDSPEGFRDEATRTGQFCGMVFFGDPFQRLERWPLRGYIQVTLLDWKCITWDWFHHLRLGWMGFHDVESFLRPWAQRNQRVDLGYVHKAWAWTPFGEVSGGRVETFEPFSGWDTFNGVC